MRYALLVCREETTSIGTEAEMRAALKVFTDALGPRLVVSTRLRPTASATTVRVRDGGLVVADGPFAETKEQIGGFFIVECEDLDEAIELAAQVPIAPHGTIEVRPVWEM
jgi:hypothetical protein